MTKQDLVDAGALLQGHFLLSSGLHSEQYMQCALLLAHPDKAQSLGAELAASWKGPKPDLVLSPAMGGLIIGQEVARALKVRHFFTEREEGVMTLRRGFRLKPGEKVLIIEDVITTGKSSREVIDLARSKGAEVVAALSIVCRCAAAPDLGVPTASLLNVPISSYPAERCPLCRRGDPLVKPGSRKTT